MYRVVVIDDNRIVVQSVCQTIDWKTLGCEIAGTAFNELDGAALVRSLSPDIVITDIMMPGYDGLEMIRLLREASSAAKYIVITGYSNFGYAQTSIRLGVSDFILKPIIDEELSAAVAKVVAELSDKAARPVFSEPEDEVECAIAEIKTRLPDCSPLIRESIQFIDVHLLDNLSLAVLCEEFSVSPSHLSKCFKKESGCSFMDYVTLCKMSRAKSLLKNPKNRVYEVGLMLGYKDYAYFYQVFKKQFGYPPSELK